jgi:hypothetical protein
MASTYTYTARSADSPENVVTFTIADHSVMVDTGAPVEQVERTLEATQAKVEGRHRAQPWLKPMTVSAIERLTHPFSLGDVYATTHDGGLAVKAWVRAGGLRLAPVVFDVEHVDNPVAAQAFVDELRQRKASMDRPGRFPGFLDYWATWFAAGFSAAVFLGVWVYRIGHYFRKSRVAQTQSPQPSPAEVELTTS